MSKIFQYACGYFSICRILLGIAGFTLLYTAFLMYDDDEGRLQNRLEGWWCKLDDASNTALNVNLRIIQGFARLAEEDTVHRFGKQLISYQSIGVIICLSIISAKLIVVAGGLFATNILPIIGFLVVCLMLLWWSKRPRFLPARMHSMWFWTVIVLWLMLIVVAYLSGTRGNRVGPPLPTPTGPDTGFFRLGIAVLPLYSVGVLISIPFCLFYIATLRRSIDLITRSISNSGVIAGTILQGIISLLAISAQIIGFKTLRSNIDFRQHIFQVVTPMVGYAYFMTICLALLIAHRLFWATMKRPIYLLARLGVERRRKLFISLGVLFIGSAFPKITEFMKEHGFEFIKSIFG